MNRNRTRAGRRLAAGAVLLLLAACSGGGGGGGSPTFALFAVEPNESLDLNGGDTVVIRGDNFLAARVSKVTFGDGNPAFNMVVLDDEHIQVTTPPSPTGQPAIVTVEVETLRFGIKGIFAGYRYVGEGGTTGPPQPATIFPTKFSPAGAQPFTIQGTSLGVGGGTVTVTFSDAGSVTGHVNQDGTIVTGRAPVTVGIPPLGPLSVTVDNGEGQGIVPAQVSYTYAAPTELLVPWQEGGDNSSRPVRVNDTTAVMCTSGTDATWGNGNDDIYLISGPPGTIQVRSVLGTLAATFRNLDRDNSIPVVLDADTICVYSPGLTAALGDEVILVISNLTAATPTVNLFQPMRGGAPLAIRRVPLGRVSATRVGFILAGTGAGGRDELQVATVITGVVAGMLPNAVNVDFADFNATRGRRNQSIPYSPDGDSVFVYSFGPNGLQSDQDDTLVRHRISTATTTPAIVPYVLTKPVVLSATRAVAIAGGMAASPPDVDDQLTVIDFSGATSVSQIDLNAFADTGAPRPMVRLGDENVVLIAGGADRFANTSDDLLAVFTDDGAGSYSRTNTSLDRRPVLMTLGNGDVCAFGRGSGGTNNGDERAIRILADGSAFNDFDFSPSWSLFAGPLGDDTRAFATDDGMDILPKSGEERLIIYQSASLGEGNQICVLPGAASLNSPIESTVANPIVFVPVGPGWGVIQSPGRNGFWLGVDDYILIVQY